MSPPGENQFFVLRRAHAKQMYRHLSQMPEIRTVCFTRVSKCAFEGWVCLTKPFLRCSTVSNHPFLSVGNALKSIGSTENTRRRIVYSFQTSFGSYENREFGVCLLVYQNSIVLGWNIAKITAKSFPKANWMW